MKNIVIGLITIVLAMVAGFYYGSPKEELGSVNIANEYKYSQLTGSVASTSAVISASTLGSIVVTEDQALAIDVWDATSTEAIGSPYAYKIADMEASQAEGVYTFDVSLRHGIVLNTTDWTAFAGDWTITYR